MNTLITGGLGYIGSHIANQLPNSIILDNCSNSNLNFKKFLPNCLVYIMDLNFNNLEKIFSKHKINSVIHLAGLKSVDDSITNPLKYYDRNVVTSIELLNAMNKFNVNKLIFSSSATVYGNDQICPLTEDLPLKSINPYGSSKIIIEQLISDYSRSNTKFKAISLRYFNPIGANVKSGLSDRPLGKPQNLMPILIRSIFENKKLKIFGNDYNTPDGTCVRDYIHIEDLALAHIKALNKISKIKGHIPINVGLGKGLSVLNFVKIFEDTNKIKVSYKFAKRRTGDSQESFACIKKANNILQWKPTKNYSDMMHDSWNAFLKQND